MVAGVVFFANRATRYLLATAAMTLLVLLCFNQVGNGAGLIVPRLVDTAIGSAIAGLAVLLVLPHWQARRINELAATAMRSHAGYLRRIVEQYRTGARDSLDYRLARRNDHNADAALSTAVAHMFREPGFVRPRAGVALRFLIRSHTLLSYLSALGAHRAALPDPARAAVLREDAEGAAKALEALAVELLQADTKPVMATATATAAAVDAPAAMADAIAEAATRAALAAVVGPDDETDQAARLFRTELTLVWLQIDALRAHAREWLQTPSDAPAEPAPAVTA
ncbi:hypothetical protein BH10PSE18_BH10PSE18_06010 [soil metagenome]